MQRTRLRNLALITAIATALVWLIVDGLVNRGMFAPLVPLMAALVPLALAVALLWGGLRVRKYVGGRDTPLTALGAARVVVLAKAASHGGAGFLGAYLAVFLAHLGTPTSPLVTQQLWTTGLTAAAFLGLIVVALVVEGWCHIDPDQEDGSSSGASPTSPSTA